MSVPMQPTDPAYWMLQDDFTTTREVYRDYCYICTDPEFAQMGLPLCRRCDNCISGGHIAADDTICDECDTCFASACYLCEIGEHVGRDSS